MTSVAIGTTAVLLLVLSTIAVIVVSIDAGVQALQSRVNVIAYLKDGTSPAALSALESEMRSRPDVAVVTYISKDEALKRLQKQFASHPGLLGAIKDNPLPASLDVRLVHPSAATDVGKALQAQPSISDVIINEDVVNRLVTAGRFVRLVGAVMVIGLSVAVIFIMTNVSRLAIFTRRAEIEVMRLVGASEWFVRWPFVLEGALCGAAASLSSFLIVAAGYHSLIPVLRGSFAFLSLPVDPLLLPKLLLLGLLIGVGVGVLGSLIAVRRFWEPATS
ncbi:MAG: ABC transporter permease [Chloroflexi bacterium]|nr:ABC transporter permease [Chloroflexota bacterium]